MAEAVELTLRNLTRRFGRRRVFEDVSAIVSAGQSLVVTGANGSGKSTLLKIVAGLLRPTSGTAEFRVGGRVLGDAERQAAMGYVSPELALYSELTGVENLRFFGQLRGRELARADLAELLERVGLKGRGRDLVADYSSGMKQRLKYAFALLHEPDVLLLDEPTANLDAAGVAIVRDIVRRQRERGVVLIATNEAHEVDWGDQVVRLGDR